MTYTTLDIFCAIVDNYGDIGVVYRFARAFHHAHPDIQIRVFVDDLITFHAINSDIDIGKSTQTHDSIMYINTMHLDQTLLLQLGVAQVIIETFACEIPALYMKRALHESKLLINLEHLSAEPWVEEYHCKESLLHEGTLRKFYFMPGFTQKTGGLIIDTTPEFLLKNENGMPLWQGVLPKNCVSFLRDPEILTGTIFTYTRGFEHLVNDCLAVGSKVCLLAFGDKSIKSIEHTLSHFRTRECEQNTIELENCTIIKMPFIPQPSYDSLLRQTDFNIVRGEDSLARAILAGKPFLWNAYIQDNTYQIVKVNAVCEMMKPWFDDVEQFESYKSLMLEFNSASREELNQVTHEQFLPFFHNLKKIRHIFRDISYFMTLNCDLVKNLTTFIREYPYNI